MNDDLRAMEDSEGACQRQFDAVMAERDRQRRGEILMTLWGLSICGILLYDIFMVVMR